MSAQTQVYLYNQRQWVVLFEASANAIRRYEKVYSKELKINQGVDNVIEFAFINQEQKPVDISGKEVTCRILNHNGTEILLQKALVHKLPIKGITSLQLTAADTETLQQQKCYYTLEIPVDNFDVPVFVDEDSGARGVIQIVNSVLPSFVESTTVTIPSHLKPKFGVSRTYFSSIIRTKQSSVLTIQTWFKNFTGIIQYQGSTLQDFSTFYNLSSEINYSDITDTYGYTIDGYHPFVRLKIINNGTSPADTNGDLAGDIVNISVR